MTATYEKMFSSLMPVTFLQFSFSLELLKGSRMDVEHITTESALQKQQQKSPPFFFI